MPTRSKWQALPTEAINPATLAIDKLPAAGIVDLMLAEDRKMLLAVQRERDRIALGADLLAKALRKGGRIVFVGAGTSGRLGVLESAEMPPTFGTDTDIVQAIMAGGKGAILKAKEGSEDNYEEGARAVTRLQPTKQDVVIGVSASGMTSFVRGALTSARQAGARIIFITCDPRTRISPAWPWGRPLPASSTIRTSTRGSTRPAAAGRRIQSSPTAIATLPAVSVMP